MKQSINPQVQKFYSHLKTIAISNVPSFYGFSHRNIKVLGNSKDYPNSIAISIDDICDMKTNGFVLVRYNETGKHVAQYGITSMELMKVYNAFLEGKNTLLCEANLYNKNGKFVNKTDLTRITWEYLDNYEFSE